MKLLANNQPANNLRPCVSKLTKKDCSADFDPSTPVAADTPRAVTKNALKTIVDSFIFGGLLVKESPRGQRACWVCNQETDEEALCEPTSWIIYGVQYHEWQ